MSEEQFTKLFKYVEDFRNDTGVRFDNIDNKFDGLHTVIDGYASKIDSYALEMAAMDHKIQRLEKYIHILADKAGVDLETIKV